MRKFAYLSWAFENRFCYVPKAKNGKIANRKCHNSFEVTSWTLSWWNKRADVSEVRSFSRDLVYKRLHCRVIQLEEVLRVDIIKKYLKGVYWIYFVRESLKMSVWCFYSPFLWGLTRLSWRGQFTYLWACDHCQPWFILF